MLFFLDSLLPQWQSMSATVLRMQSRSIQDFILYITGDVVFGSELIIVLYTSYFFHNHLLLRLLLEVKWPLFNVVGDCSYAAVKGEEKDRVRQAVSSSTIVLSSLRARKLLSRIGLVLM